jgi:hypothetical protein
MEKNLKLAMIGQLMTDDVLPLFDLDVFFEEHLGQPYDGCADYNYAPIPEVEAYLTHLELDDSALLPLTRLAIDGGDEIYHYVWPQWEGEDDYFAFISLDGIEQCINLTSLDICGILSDEQPLELSALTALPAFQNLALDGAYLLDLQPLLDIATLQTVTLTYTRIESTEANQQALHTLRTRGVSVTAPL